MIFRGESRNILGKFCGNSVDKFFEIFLDTRSDLCYNRLGTKLFQACGCARKTLHWHSTFALAQTRTSFYHFTTLLGAERAKLNANENHSHLQVKEKPRLSAKFPISLMWSLYEKCLEVSSNPWYNLSMSPPLGVLIEWLTSRRGCPRGGGRKFCRFRSSQLTRLPLSVGVRRVGFLLCFLSININIIVYFSLAVNNFF